MCAYPRAIRKIFEGKIINDNKFKEKNNIFDKIEVGVEKIAKRVIRQTVDAGRADVVCFVKNERASDQ